MKTTLLKTLAAIVCLLCNITVFAEIFEVDGIYYNITSETEKTVEVTYRYGGYTGSVVIPETVTYSGTKYSVTSIGERAFFECIGLTEVTIPNSVTSIGIYAFIYCEGLTEVTIGNSVTSIGKEAFYYCTGLKEVTIPNSVTSIGERAFCHCTELISIVVEKGNTVYDSRENCNAIIETTTNTLITGCKNTIIPNSVTSIGDAAFSGCTGLTEITIPNSVTSIGNLAFFYCTGLTEVTIGNSVTSIGGGAFYECMGLTEVTIPNSVTSIGNLAFYECYSIKDVYAYPTEPPTIYDNTFEDYNATLHIVNGYKDVYAEAPYWDYFTNITDDLTSVEGVRADEAFSVTVVGGTLAITGAADNAVVNIYNTNGALLHHTTVAQASGIALPNGIYLVQVNGVTKKVAL